MRISVSRFWPRTEGGYAWFIKALNAAATFMVFLIVLLIVGDVVGRTIFKNPIIGTSEIVRNTIVVICFMQIAHVLRVGRHIGSTVLSDRLRPLGKELAQILTSSVGLALFIMLLLGGWDVNWTAWQVHEYEGEGALNFPTYPVRSIILLGGILISIQFLLNLYRSARAVVRLAGSRRVS